MTFSVLVAMTTTLSVASASQRAEGAAIASAQVPTPTVEGPILPSSGISYLGSTTFNPSVIGYEQSEFFLSGTATAYKSSQPLTKDGKWHVTPQTTAPYTTRAVVYRPVDPTHFDGTVVVEWLNVTGGIDAPAAWLNAHIQMIRQGMAFIGIDAQEGGIYGQAGSIASKDGFGGLKTQARYAALKHPGDSFSYSIYQQAGEALHADGSQLLGGLVPQRVIAARGVAVRLPPRHVHQRSTTALTGHLRRLLRLQPWRRRRGSLAITPADHPHPDADVHPHRPPRAHLPVRDGV